MKISVRYFNGPSDWEWVRSKVRLLRVEDTCGLIAEDETGKKMGAAIFDNFLHNSAQVTLVLESPMLIRHGFLDAAYEFLFEDCGKNFCYALVAENNSASRRLTEHVGYVEKMRIPEGFRAGVDYVVYELSRYAFYNRKNKVKEAA